MEEQRNRKESRMYSATWLWVCATITAISIGVAIFTVTTKPAVPTAPTSGAMQGPPSGSAPDGQPHLMQQQAQ